MQNLFCYLRQMSSLSLPLFGESLKFRAQPFRLSFQATYGIRFTRKRNPRVFGAAVFGAAVFGDSFAHAIGFLPVNPL